MPYPCFSYPADGLAGSEGRDVARPNLRDPRRMPGGTCFSYSADVSVGTPNRGAARATPRDPRGVGYPCFSYPQMCFGYPDEVRLGTGNRDAAQPDLRRMPLTCCFRY